MYKTQCRYVTSVQTVVTCATSRQNQCRGVRPGMTQIGLLSPVCWNFGYSKYRCYIKQRATKAGLHLFCSYMAQDRFCHDKAHISNQILWDPIRFMKVLLSSVYSVCHCLSNFNMRINTVCVCSLLGKENYSSGNGTLSQINISLN